ncbi:lactonase family protein [Niveispirillum sp. KHB5.9]|uniref:lactonase family protein n=1 Tax=Niveispirillum sp. KHB5.9 TaxID=3400269 RepID=UPI003A86E86F
MGLLSLLVLGGPGMAGACEGTDFYIGTQGSGPGQGVFTARLDEKQGTLCLVGLAAELERPTWVEAHPTKPLLYAASDDKAGNETRGRVIALRTDGADGRLTAFSSADSAGAGATHLAFDAKGKAVFTANFRSGTVGAVPVAADGTLSAPTGSVQNAGTGPKPRLTSPHAHGVALEAGGRYLFVPDLGADKLFVYRYDAKAGTLAPANVPSVSLPPGTGPRHVALHPKGRFVYLLYEFSPVIWVYKQGAKTGGLTLLQSLATGTDDEADAVKGAEIAISADGRFIYTSTRGENMIGVHAVKRDGTLREVQRVPSGGKVPWSFRLGPKDKWLLATNQGSNSITLFRRDARTGRLKPSGQPLSVTLPTSVAFLKG